MARKKKKKKVKKVVKLRKDIASVCGWCRKRWKDQSNFWHKSDIDTFKYTEANWKGLKKSTCPKCKGELYWDRPDYHVKESFNNRLTEALGDLEAPDLPDDDKWTEEDGVDFWSENTTICVYYNHGDWSDYNKAWMRAIDIISERFGPLDDVELYQGLDVGPGEAPWNQVIANYALAVMFGIVNDEHIENYLINARADTIHTDPGGGVTWGGLNDEIVFADDKWIDYSGGQIQGDFVIIIS